MLSKYNKTVGNKGENIAVWYLRLRFYKILERNYKRLNGEIDIIAKRSNTIVFVEVKTRTNNDYGGGLAAVTPQKQYYIRRTAQYYLKNKKNADIRFDVIDIYGKIKNEKFKKISLNHIKGAF